MYTLKTELEYLTDGYKEKEEYLDNINANEIFDDMIKQLINHIDSGADNIRTIIKEVSGFESTANTMRNQPVAQIQELKLRSLEANIYDRCLEIKEYRPIILANVENLQDAISRPYVNIVSFDELNRLCEEMVLVIDNILNAGSGSGKSTAVSDMEQKIQFKYFPATLLANIFNTVSAELFDPYDITDFFRFMNLNDVELPPTIRRNQIGRVFYLLYWMGEKLTSAKREEWFPKILMGLKQDKAYYDRKSRSVEKEPVSRANEKYIGTLNEIFNLEE